MRYNSGLFLLIGLFSGAVNDCQGDDHQIANDQHDRSQGNGLETVPGTQHHDYIGQDDDSNSCRKDEVVAAGEFPFAKNGR